MASKLAISQHRPIGDDLPDTDTDPEPSLTVGCATTWTPRDPRDRPRKKRPIGFDLTKKPAAKRKM